MEQKKVLFAEVSLLFITIIWGLGFPITKIAIESGFQASTIMVGRFVIATIILTIIYFRKLKFLNKKIIFYGLLTGVFLFLGFYFQTLGNVYTTPSKNGFITQLNIIFVPYLYYLFFKKKVTKYNVLSVIVATIGLYLLSFSKSNLNTFNIGDFYTFICAIMVAFHVVTGSYYQKKYDFDPALFVLMNIFISAILSLTMMLSFDTIPAITVGNIWPLIFLGFFNTALGFLVQSYALKISVPTRVSIIVAMESLFGAIGSVLIIGEILTLEIVVGGLLIITGVLISELFPIRKKKNKQLKESA
ncbi:MAG: DMT family transporter [Candidatus Izimaplasma sp.]|nr:DMT family transporter [Candidatus Izimaplasma bacterium]